MGYCKNCGNETKNNNVYCSLKCRNIYVNKNLRDYKKNGEGISKKKYYSPKKCKACGKEIIYENRDNIFCNHSCAAKYINKNRVKVNFKLSKEGLKSLRNANKIRDYEKKKEYYSNIKRCKNCDKMIRFNRRHHVFCDRKCKNEFYKNKRTNYENYKKNCQFNFNLKDYPNEFEFKLIEKYGWYKAKNRGNNIDGVSRDHMFSISEGFKNNVDPKIISHPANCKLIRNIDNQFKNIKCSITLKELKNKIERWNIKYIGVESQKIVP